MADETVNDETPVEAAAEEAAEAVAETEAVPEPADVPEAEAEPADVPEAEAAQAAGAGEAEVTEAGAGEAAAAGTTPKRKRKRLPRAQRAARTKPKRAKPAERKPITRLEKPEAVRGRRQERQGVVVSAGSDKTIVVSVVSLKAHPKYKKVMRRSTRFHAHDEQNTAKVGDVVRIVETRPLSRLKRWRLAEIVEAAK